jgi:transposase
VGIDWADKAHEVALVATGSADVELRTLPQSPEAIHGWLSELEKRFSGAPVAIALETSRGPLVHALLESPIVLLYPVNPRSMHSFRETFSPNGAKDDAPDARLLLELLLKHREKFKPFHPQSAKSRELKRLVEYRRDMVDDRKRLGQRLQALLKEFYPIVLQLVGDEVTSPMACDFLDKWPTFAQLKRARLTTITQFYTQHNCRSAKRRDTYLARIASAQPLTTDAAIIDSSALLVTAITPQVRALNEGIAKFEASIAQLFAAMEDAPIFSSLPGAGAALAPRLLVAFGEDRERFPCANDVAEMAGIAPVTIKSGNSRLVRRRWATDKFLLQSFHEFAAASIPHCGWVQTSYHALRRRGKSHHEAVRTLAFKWIRIIWRCWQDRTPYDDARYNRALAIRGSSLAHNLTTTHAA